MTADQTDSAMRALNNATAALANNRQWIAQAWADTASDVIREAQLSGPEQRALIAPRDSATRGDKAVLGFSLLVIVWMLADVIGGLL